MKKSLIKSGQINKLPLNVNLVFYFSISQIVYMEEWKDTSLSVKTATSQGNLKSFSSLLYEIKNEGFQPYCIEGLHTISWEPLKERTLKLKHTLSTLKSLLKMWKSCIIERCLGKESILRDFFFFCEGEICIWDGNAVHKATHLYIYRVYSRRNWYYKLACYISKDKCLVVNNRDICTR